MIRLTQHGSGDYLWLAPTSVVLVRTMTWNDETSTQVLLANGHYLNVQESEHTVVELVEGALR